MAGRGSRWVKDPGGIADFKEAKPVVDLECQRIIAELYKPRLVHVRPDPMHNYIIDVFGAWHGKSFRFVQKYRSGTSVAPIEEFDSPFTRLEYYEKDNYNLYFFRHTGKWSIVAVGLPLNAALKAIREEEILQPYF